MTRSAPVVFDWDGHETALLVVAFTLFGLALVSGCRRSRGRYRYRYRRRHMRLLVDVTKRNARPFDPDPDSDADLYQRLCAEQVGQGRTESLPGDGESGHPVAGVGGQLETARLDWLMKSGQTFPNNIIGLLRKTHILSLAKQLAPANYEKIKDRYSRYYSIRKQAREGYVLVDLPELQQAFEKAALHLIDELGSDQVGDYLEFGVFYGSSLACMHRVLDHFGLRHVRLFGFDSFEGLPPSVHPDDRVWGEGEFKSSYRFAREYLTQQGVDWTRVTLEKGWFSDTLTDEFRKRHDLRKASLIMIDCDMYVSARQALDFCAPLIHSHSIIFFDDWNSGNGLAERGEGEKRAFDEFLSANLKVTAEEFGGYSYQGHPNAKVFKMSVRE